MATRVLVIDNYDSFVFNLVQYLGELGAEPLVFRNDERSVAELAALDPDAVLISPGPGNPDDAGLSNEVIAHFAGHRPVFGVCLGLQCIGQLYGGKVVRAPARDARQDLVHRAPAAPACSPVSPIRSRPPATTRWWSTATRCPTASRSPPTSDDGLVMGLRHRELDVEGVQFHPESVLTVGGHQLLANFLARAAV